MPSLDESLVDEGAAAVSQAELPLQGLRVIDFTRVLAGPLCTMLLGDMGAEVIKIEDPRHGDDTRAWAPFVDGWSTYFLVGQPQQEERRARLKSDEGRALLDDLIATADVLIENFRPGTMERLGFGAGSRARAQRAADLLLDLRLRRQPARGATNPATTW